MPAKWWGWGDERKSFALADPQRFWTFLEQRVGKTREAARLRSLDEVALRPSRLDGRQLAALRRIIGNANVSADTADRAVHSLGKGYRDLVRIRRGEIAAPTDAIVYPDSDAQVAATLDLAASEAFAVIPFGGGTSVVGGVEPFGDKPTLTLDLRRMARVVAIDRVSGLATVEAGIFGPALEAALNAAGFTLGHFPQSFEYSTLGGWIATRSAGQNSTRYGKIEENVESVRLHFPGGVIETPAVPAAATGPDFNQLVAGSEGAFGIITSAVIRLARLPEGSDYRAYLMHDFEAGVEAAREMLQSGLTPSLLRLSDEVESEATALMQAGAEGMTFSLFLLGFDGDEAEVRSCWERAEAVMERHGGRSLGSGPGEAWRRSRFEAPYLRDVLLDRSVMVDTLETATTWSNYLPLYRATRDAMQSAMGGRGIVMAHLSHAYTHGASVYYTFLARQSEGEELEQWQEVKDAATRAIIDGGGALSHHHAIGVEHRRWLSEYLGDSSLKLIRSLKRAFDPSDIMNPGKLIPPAKEMT
ncbi:MAG: FAD-binding oxidoreductase [Dehalococcoidia bacterium]|jgi:alkyldihydroxyacetonephosphate synthase